MVPKLEGDRSDGLVTVLERNAARFLESTDEFAHRYVLGQDDGDREKAIAYRAGAGVLNQVLAFVHVTLGGGPADSKAATENAYRKAG